VSNSHIDSKKQAHLERKQPNLHCSSPVNISESTKEPLQVLEQSNSSLKKAGGQAKHQAVIAALDNNHEQKSHEAAQRFQEKKPK